MLERDIHITDKTTPKDVARVLMTKDEFDFTSTYYYGIRKMEVQEELQKLTAFWISIIFLSLIPSRKILMNLKAGLSIMKVRVL